MDFYQFEDFKLSKLNFLLKLKDRVVLPKYKGSTFRGGFGHVFRKVVCPLKGKVCSECILKEKCIYSYIFETLTPKDTKKMRKYPYVPHPFIIEPPLDKKTEYITDEFINFKLILIGKAIDYLPYFIYTFCELGKIGIGKNRAKFDLYQVKNDGTNKDIIYKKVDETLKDLSTTVIGWQDILSRIDSKNEKNIDIVFLTPTRIKFNGHLLLDLDFSIFIRNLLRRISSLFYFHLDKEIELDFNKIITSAKEVKIKSRELYWQDWQRYSKKQDSRMKLGGFMGNISFKGNIGKFLPLIYIGELLHVGKGTSFGLGKYKIL